MTLTINNLQNKTKNILQKSNISKFLNSTSQTDMLRFLNPQSAQQPEQQQQQQQQEEDTLQAMSDVFESITSDGIFVNEFIEYLYNTYPEEILNNISNDIKIIHAKKPYNINITKGPNRSQNPKSIKEIPFFIEKEQLTNQKGKYTYNNRYGLIKKNVDPKDELLNIEDIADPVEGNTSSFINNVNESSLINPSKENTSLAYILINNPNLRAGTRNTLELSTFFNTLSTIELSKCYPYLNISLILPKIFRNVENNIFESATLTNFFKGTIDDKSKTTDLYKNISNNIIQLSLSQATSGQQANIRQMNKSNMSIFTTPQTLVNFNENKIGNYFDNDGKNDDYKRLNAVQDIARPFMSIKNFSVDVAPTQGLMSFKTGKLSLVLHDKSRLPEIAPFIKADLFGTSGSEIAIEYGWDSIDKDNPNNFLGSFLANNRVLEKYIITNSSFNMTNNGEVNIDLSIALKGPVDLRTVKLSADPFSTIEKRGLQTLYNIITNDYEYIKAGINDVEDGKKEFENFKSLIDSLYNVFFNIDNSLYKQYVEGKKQDQQQQSKEQRLFNLYLDTSTNKRPKTIELTTGSKTVISYDDNKITIDDDIYVDLISGEGNVNVIESFFKECEKIYRQILQNEKKVDEITKKIIRGLGEVDPFYDKDFVFDYYRMSDARITSGEPKYIQVGGLPESVAATDTKGATDYVTFGALLSSIIGQHFCHAKKYDEIQIISYTANRNAGLMAYRNLSSLMIRRADLNEFLKDLFKNGREFSIEGLISQILNEFVTTRTNICYGLNSNYTKDIKTGVVSPKEKDVQAQNKNVNNSLQKIYNEIINDRVEKINPNKQKITTEKIIYPFEMPKIKLSFDTLTNKDDALERTILRISVYDELDNPFSSISEMLTAGGDNNIFKTVGILNRIKLEKGKKDFIEHGGIIFNDLLQKNYIKEDPIGSGLYVIDKSFGLLPFKNEFKKIMPSVTYGTENSAILDASVTTINEAKLNTVFLTRESSKSNETTQVVSFGKDLPLRVLPSQANLTIFGCPFVNFAQYYFLDFLTGTTIDNIYAVTGIKHDISPGKFTTSLTMSYGDIYGKYENALSTLNDVAVKKKVKK